MNFEAMFHRCAACMNRDIIFGYLRPRFGENRVDKILRVTFNREGGEAIDLDNLETE